LNILPVFGKFKGAALSFDANAGDFSEKYDILISNHALRKKLSKKSSAIGDKFINNKRFKGNLRKLLI